MRGLRARTALALALASVAAVLGQRSPATASTTPSAPVSGAAAATLQARPAERDAWSLLPAGGATADAALEELVARGAAAVDEAFVRLALSPAAGERDPAAAGARETARATRRFAAHLVARAGAGGDVERALAALVGCPAALLHCVTAYPAPPGDYNLALLAPLAVLLALDAAAQMVGIALGTLGLVRRHRAREAEPAADTPAPSAASSRRGWGLAVVPTGTGLALSGWF